MKHTVYESEVQMLIIYLRSSVLWKELVYNRTYKPY